MLVETVIDQARRYFTALNTRAPQDAFGFYERLGFRRVEGEEFVTHRMIVFLFFFAYFVFYLPNYLGHPDNYTVANPLKTPAHIVPEWYFLPFYAILRAITFNIGPINSKLGGVLCMVETEGAVVDPAKDVWKRPRPHQLSDLVKPAVKLSSSGSWPSGHATVGTMLGGSSAISPLAGLHRIDIRGIEGRRMLARHGLGNR